MAMLNYSMDWDWETLRVSAATSVADNYSKMGTAVGSDAAESGTTTTVINATSHAAQVGDIIIMTSGGEDGEAREVSAVDTNTITLASALSGAPSATETFNIIRPVQTGAKAQPKICIIKSTLNQPVMLSFDGTNDHLPIEGGDDLVLDLKSNNLHMENGDSDTEGFIYVKTDGTAPTSGSIYISAVK